MGRATGHAEAGGREQVGPGLEAPPHHVQADEAQAGGCGTSGDPLACSGNWYAAGVYADGHGSSYDGNTGIALCPSASGLIVNNVFEGNDIALMLYFHARAAVRSNVFMGNHHGLVLNHFQDAALVANNVFWENRGLAIGNTAAYADIVNNVIARSGTGISFEYIQQGRVRCNLFFDNGENWVGTGDEPRLVLGEDGNVEQDPRFRDPGQVDFRLGSDSPGRDRGCFGHGAPDVDGSAQDVGAYGGAFGSWLSTSTASAQR